MTEENTAAEAVADKPKIERIRQNGVTRPAEGTMTGAIWQAADNLSAHFKRPVLMAELVENLGEDYNRSTVATQYNLWCNFNGVTAAQRKAIRDEGKAEEKAAVEAAKAEAKAVKEAERSAKAAEKAAAKEAAKAAKAAEAAAKAEAAKNQPEA